MVVEDEPDIYELLLAMFEIWGIEGVAFVDGEEAITWIDESDKGVPSEIPELAVLDIRLPGNVSGPMVGQRVRQSPVLNGMAIVLITAYKLTVDEEKAVTEQAGADKILYKPLPKFNELKKILETAIRERKAITEAALQKAKEPEKPEKPEKIDKPEKVQKEN
jgi:CheY-like chemotaxis protein